jgi:dipeptidyl aminopeptidase/acylaminoacyl peptidase
MAISLVFFTCNASAQKEGAGYKGESATVGGGQGRLQSMVAELSKSEDPKAGRLARKIKAVGKELKNDGKNLKQLQPHLNRMEKAARQGDYKAADRALNDTIGAAYDAQFWETITFKSTDGFKVYSYMSKPKNKKTYPIIVLVHGGEHGSATTYQRHALRFLKAGFATLAVDYRGSSGHGQSYYDAIDFGGKEIDDVVKAVEHAHADPATTKVGLMGSSHGAFVSSNVVPRSSLVASANLNFGGYDFEAVMDTWQKSSAPEAQRHIEYWGPVIGEPGTPEYERAATLSAINNVDKINVPLLLIHGKKDTSVPYIESVKLHDELKKNKKRVTLKLFEDGPHGFILRNSEEAEEAYRITENFFKKTLK